MQVELCFDSARGNYPAQVDECGGNFIKIGKLISNEGVLHVNAVSVKQQPRDLGCTRGAARTRRDGDIETEPRLSNYRFALTGHKS